MSFNSGRFPVSSTDEFYALIGWKSYRTGEARSVTGVIVAPVPLNLKEEGPMADQNTRMGWQDEDEYWRNNYRNRPYASRRGGDYDMYQPGYRYGFDAANRYEGREWNDVESDLSRGWDSYEHRGNSTWEDMKDAVRDAWDRMTGKRSVGARH
jgi:hypothetical protein